MKTNTSGCRIPVFVQQNDGYVCDSNVFNPRIYLGVLGKTTEHIRQDARCTGQYSNQPRTAEYKCSNCCVSLLDSHDLIHPWPYRRHCATSREVAGSIPDGDIGIYHWHNPSGRTMFLGSTQPLTQMSTRDICWAYMRPVRRADNLTTFTCQMSRNVGASTSWNTQGLSRLVQGLLYIHLLLYLTEEVVSFFCISEHKRTIKFTKVYKAWCDSQILNIWRLNMWPAKHEGLFWYWEMSSILMDWSVHNTVCKTR
jgi:hypothetical protein